jgi:heparan-alpha-glucosaminide N-acetyltransferase
MSLHAFWRALILVCLGIFLRSLGRSQTNFVFEDTLSQIGLGYGILFLLGLRATRDVVIALALILVGTWAAFALYPLPGPDFNWAAAGVAKDWSENLSGFAAHWNKNTSPAWAFDTWFLNLFPREGNKPFLYNGGGYSTLSFIPTLATMLLGLLAGRLLRSDRGRGGKLAWLLVAGLASLALGELLGWLGICPVVKRIWTPSWVLWSGGCCFILLATFYTVIDVFRVKLWAFPLVVIGMNSITAYCMADLISGFIGDALRRHLSESVFLSFGAPYESLVEGSLRLLVLWLILLWMYRRKIFVRI